MFKMCTSIGELFRTISWQMKYWRKVDRKVGNYSNIWHSHGELLLVQTQYFLIDKASEILG